MPTHPDGPDVPFWYRHLAELGHEVRGPLHAIIGLSELLSEESRGPLNTEQQAIVADMRLAARHVLHLADDVLALSRLQNGTLDLELEILSLAAVVEQALRLARGLCHRKQIVLEADIAHDVAVYADERRTLQVLHNLLTNAVHYGPPGTLVRITARPEQTVVWTLVEDNGAGIDPADQDRIFDPFVAVKCGDARRGVGLGLAVCKSMVTAMGGGIEVCSTPGEGSVFRFSLPRAEAPV